MLRAGCVPGARASRRRAPFMAYLRPAHRGNIRDCGRGDLAASPKVRVRLYENHATLTVKTKKEGPARTEFEYEIPVKDAEELITVHCAENTLTKTRCYVPHQGFTWEVDVYEGILSGVILAEIELERADVDVPLSDWIGPEVTGDPS